MPSLDDQVEAASVTGPNINRVRTLGSVRLTREGTNEHILWPKPTDDPNDPLNWSKAYKIYLMALTSLALIMANFVTAGPSITIVQTTVDLFHVIPPTPLYSPSLAPASLANFGNAIGKAAYLYSGTALATGLSNLLWVPMALKYGRRKVWVATFLAFGAFSIWSALATSYGSLMAARILMGWMAGSAECVAPLTVGDLFFLHERGFYMGVFAAALSAGVPLGTMVGGLLTLGTTWRTQYYLGAGIVFLIAILAFLTMPETAYARVVEVPGSFPPEHEGDLKKQLAASHLDRVCLENGHNTTDIPPKKSFRQNLSFSMPIKTKEPFLKIVIRPILLLALPSVLWSTISVGLCVGIYVALTVSLPNDYLTIYHFQTWQAGLTSISILIGTFTGMFVCGYLSDHIADFFTRRAGGLRDPEHRLPNAIVPALILPAGLLMYGFGLEYSHHWAVPTVALAIISLGIVGGTATGVAYVVDAYRPIAGECVVTVMAFKAAFAFLIGFYTNQWIAEDGYAAVFGTLAAIVFAWHALAIPLFFWGKGLREKSLQWRIMSLVNWNADRETGE